MRLRFLAQLPGAYDGHHQWPAPGGCLEVEDEQTARTFIERGLAVPAEIETATSQPAPETAEARRPRAKRSQ